MSYKQKKILKEDFGHTKFNKKGSSNIYIYFLKKFTAILMSIVVALLNYCNSKSYRSFLLLKTIAEGVRMITMERAIRKRSKDLAFKNQKIKINTL